MERVGILFFNEEEMDYFYYYFFGVDFYEF